MANSEYNLTVVDGTALTVSLSGPVGPAGAGGGTVDVTITDGSANAVSGNAVFDALALKAPLASPSFTTPSLGAAVMNGSIIPDTDNTRNLGSSLKYINDAYIGALYGSQIFLGYTSSGSGTGQFIIYSGNSGQFTDIKGSSTSSQLIYFPDASGTVPVVPVYADITAANAALDADDFWWDTTLKKLRRATA